ncbi:hypothetical protein [Nocardia abscessus]|uniref:hypothetical protein n=1 Tax=Nocardia abscessus TaxID=120957 RepID=UPI002455FD6A|nr:hypothetical protein [Nocardia abscessus]
MAVILVTGMSGTGKSAALIALEQLGPLVEVVDQPASLAGPPPSNQLSRSRRQGVLDGPDGRETA